jgi:hypothetical protein
MRRVTAVTAITLTLAVTACGSSAPAAPSTPAQVANQIGATNLHPYDKGPFAKDAASATWHGRSVVIAVFTSDANKQAYIKTVEGFGDQPLAQGTGYTVFPN